jgi:hypothetical protein
LIGKVSGKSPLRRPRRLEDKCKEDQFRTVLKMLVAVMLTVLPNVQRLVFYRQHSLSDTHHVSVLR